MTRTSRTPRPRDARRAAEEERAPGREPAVPGGLVEHAALLAAGALPAPSQRAIAARLARSHGNAHLQQAIAGVVVARAPAQAPDVTRGRIASTVLDERIAAHRANVAAVANAVATWRSDSQPARRNTAEWLFPTRGARRRARVHVMTKTHDAAERARANGQRGVAYFGLDTDFPSAAAGYDANDLGSRRGIHFNTASVQGAQMDRRMLIMEPASRSPDAVLTTLVHELQHFADRHEDEPDWERGYKSPEESWVRYKTEFRAYWIAGNIAGAEKPGSVAPPFDNMRQLRIFRHIMHAGAEWLGPNYDGNTEVHGRRFKDLVHGYAKPEGVNLVNSPRIDDLYVTLGRCGPTDVDVSRPPLSGLLGAAWALNDSDLAHVNSAEGKALQERLKDRLAQSAFDAVALRLGLPVWAAVNITPARRAILAAGRGPGVDKEAIYAAIAAVSPIERAEMAKDRVIVDQLKKELKGKDLWRALMYLKHGPRDWWPKAVRDQDAN